MNITSGVKAGSYIPQYEDLEEDLLKVRASELMGYTGLDEMYALNIGGKLQIWLIPKPC